ncbi:MAG: hypothetical protein EOO75_18010 [Myxococcales bacterium]|nr:MAG: hypothetical protein EOO75_18010 [Myxococcales bacterium]
MRSAPRVLDSPAPLTITRWDCLDHGEDEHGQCLYSYAYAWYELRTPHGTLTARRYADEWRQVSLFAGADGPWRSVPHEDPGFQLAVRYFADLEDIDTLRAFVGTYEDVDLERFRSSARQR